MVPRRVRVFHEASTRLSEMRRPELLVDFPPTENRRIRKTSGSGARRNVLPQIARWRLQIKKCEANWLSVTDLARDVTWPKSSKAEICWCFFLIMTNNCDFFDLVCQSTKLPANGFNLLAINRFGDSRGKLNFFRPFFHTHFFSLQQFYKLVVFDLKLEFNR